MVDFYTTECKNKQTNKQTGLQSKVPKAGIFFSYFRISFLHDRETSKFPRVSNPKLLHWRETEAHRGETTCPKLCIVLVEEIGFLQYSVLPNISATLGPG